MPFCMAISTLGITINGIPHERRTFICMQTFRKTCIPNEQRTMLISDDEQTALRVESSYGNKFRGEATPMYNCHGLTFACRRTGIYDEEVLETILREEYREIRHRKDVLSGDVVIYRNEGIIVHSGMILSVESNGLFIRVLSKEPRYKEIEHQVDFTPHIGADKKFYRINHDVRKIIQ